MKKIIPLIMIMLLSANAYAAGTAVTLNSLSAKNNSVKASWTKGRPDRDTYQLQICKRKDFSKNVSSIHVRRDRKSVDHMSYTIKGLDGRSNYYVRIRSAKVVKGKRYYSSWSSPKKIRTKKALNRSASKYENGFEEGRLFYRDDCYPNMQGICTDGKNYIYAAFREGANSSEADGKKTMLKKIDKKGNIIAENKKRSYCHANGITYCDKDKKIYIATLGRSANVPRGAKQNHPQRFNVIGVVNASNLQHNKFISVQEQMAAGTPGPVWSVQGYGKGIPAVNEKMKCPKISTVYWDKQNEKFICTVTPYKLSEEKDARTYRGIAVFSYDWELLDYVPYMSKSIYSGNACRYKNSYYLARNVKDSYHKRMTVLNEDFSIRTVVSIPAICDNEYECSDFIGDVMYASFNTRPASIHTFKIIDH